MFKTSYAPGLGEGCTTNMDTFVYYSTSCCNKQPPTLGGLLDLFFFFFFCLFMATPLHIDVSRLGVELELEL